MPGLLRFVTQRVTKRKGSGSRGAYGASPLHLLAVIASFAIAGYGFLRIFEAPSALGTLLWFGGAIVAHDLIAFPLYTALAALAGRPLRGGGARDAERRVPAINHLRIPAYLSALAFLLFFPLILRLSAERYEGSTGLRPDVYLGRWLAICGALFLGSALLYAVRLRVAGREERHSATPAAGQGDNSGEGGR